MFLSVFGLAMHASQLNGDPQGMFKTVTGGQ
jgi:hypothetical protein